MRVRKIERRLAQLDGKHRKQREENGRAVHDDGSRLPRYGDGIEAVGGKIQAHTHQQNGGLVTHNLQQLAVGADLGKRALRRGGRQHHKDRGERHHKGAQHRVGTRHKDAAAHHGKDERARHVGIVHGVYAGGGLAQQLGNVVERLQQARTHTALHAGRKLTVKTVDQTAHKRRQQGKRHGANKNAHDARTFKILAAQHRGRAHGKPLGPNPRATQKRKQDNAAAHDATCGANALLAKGVLRIPIALFGLHLVSHRAAEMAVIVGSHTRKIYVYVRLIAHAERRQQHHGNKRHDNHHQIHGVLANNVRHAAKHHGQVRRHQTARDNRKRHAAQNQQRGDGVEGHPFGLMDIDLNVLSRGVDARKLGKPLAPEEERRSRAKGKHHDHEHVASLRKRHQGTPLGHEHAKRRHKHAHDAQHHQARQVRHAAEHAVHVLDIAAADMMLGRAHAQEQQRLCHRVEQDQKDGRPYGLGRADTQAGTDEAQVGNGGVREHAFGVALRDGHEGSEQKRDGTHTRDHKAGHGIDGIERAQLDHQEHAGFDHG